MNLSLTVEQRFCINTVYITSNTKRLDFTLVTGCNI